MAIKVIAQRREVKLGKTPGMKFVMRPDLYIPIAEKKVFAEASTHSGISAGVIKAAWDAAGEVIRTWATEGHSRAAVTSGLCFYKFCFSLDLINFLTLRNENKFSFPSLNRNFALPFTLGEGGLHLRKTQINLVFRSICTTFVPLKRER